MCARTVEHSVKKRKLNIQIKWEMNKFGAQRIFPTCFFFLFFMRNHQAPLPNDAALYLLDSFLISALFLLLWLIKSIMIWDQNDSLMLFSSFLSVWIWWCCQPGNRSLNSVLTWTYKKPSNERARLSFYSMIYFLPLKVCVWFGFAFELTKLMLELRRQH